MKLRKDRTGDPFDVPTETLDAFCVSRGIRSIDILKMDVEGAEVKVLKGAEQMLKRGAIRFVFTEVFFSPAYENPVLFCDIHAALSSIGFKLWGLYSLSPEPKGRLSFANALYEHSE